MESRPRTIRPPEGSFSRKETPFPSTVFATMHPGFPLRDPRRARASSMEAKSWPSHSSTAQQKARNLSRTG